MNSSFQRSCLLLLLGFGLLFLPACGSKTAVKSQTASETVLNPETAPPPVESVNTSNVPESKTKSAVKHKKTAPVMTSSSTNSAPSTVAAAPQPTAAPAVASTPETQVAMAEAPKKSGHWLLWILLLLILGGGAWYYWSKNTQIEHPTQPMPPMGGLSPVSGFTGLKKEEEKKRTSFWNKKLF